MVGGPDPGGCETSLCGVELAHTHTSVLIEELVAQAPDGPVDLDWLLGHLDKRSFGLLLLLLGLLVIVPGVASIATLMVIFPSVEMMLGRSRPSFPRFLSKRPFDFKRFKRLTEIVQPGLRAIENLSRPRWTLPHAAAHRLVGAVVFLLALSAIWPLPLVNVTSMSRGTESTLTERVARSSAATMIVSERASLENG